MIFMLIQHTRQGTTTTRCPYHLGYPPPPPQTACTAASFTACARNTHRWHHILRMFTVLAWTALELRRQAFGVACQNLGVSDRWTYGGGRQPLKGVRALVHTPTLHQLHTGLSFVHPHRQDGRCCDALARSERAGQGQQGQDPGQGATIRVMKYLCCISCVCLLRLWAGALHATRQMRVRGHHSHPTAQIGGDRSF